MYSGICWEILIKVFSYINYEELKKIIEAQKKINAQAKRIEVLEALVRYHNVY